MKAALIAACSSLIAGCAGTIDENRQLPARATYMSSLSEPALEHCLAGDLSWTGTPSVIRGTDSTEIAFTSPYGTEPLITLLPSDRGTKVEVRFHRSYAPKMRRGIEDCVSGAAS